MTDSEIIYQCVKYQINNYTIENGRVNVHGNVSLRKLRLSRLPVPFGIVDGHFDCGVNNLKDLTDAPTYVGGWFDCSNNEFLTSFEGAPLAIKVAFYCYNPFMDQKAYNYLFELNYQNIRPTDLLGKTYIDIQQLQRQWIIGNIINED